MQGSVLSSLLYVIVHAKGIKATVYYSILVLHIYRHMLGEENVQNPKC